MKQISLLSMSFVLLCHPCVGEPKCATPFATDIGAKCLAIINMELNYCDAQVSVVERNCDP